MAQLDKLILENRVVELKSLKKRRETIINNFYNFWFSQPLEIFF